MNILEIKDLSFRYKNRFIYDGFNLSVNRGDWITIAGPNGAGKTTLVKILAGLEKSYSDIKVFNLPMNKKKNLYKIRKEIGFVFDNPENFFACETVEDELAFSLENMAVLPTTIRKKINDISKLLKIEHLLKENPYELSGGEKQKVSLACALMLEPRMLVLDEALLMIDINERKEILDVLKKYNEEKRVTIISLTHNLDEAIYSNRLIVLNKGIIVVDGDFKEVFKEERVMRKIGLEVPFCAELSQKLRIFNLIDDLELDLERLVSLLWK